VSDARIPHDAGTDGKIDYYTPVVKSAQDYYPFGMQMPGRNITTNKYRFGYQGEEADMEIYGDKSAYAFKYRMHDARIGRFWSLDPLAKKYPQWAPYVFSGNRVIGSKEMEGLQPIYRGGGPNSSPTHMDPKLSASDHQEIHRKRQGRYYDKINAMNKKTIDPVFEPILNKAKKTLPKQAFTTGIKEGLRPLVGATAASGASSTASFLLLPKSTNDPIASDPNRPKLFTNDSETNNKMTIEEGDTFSEIEEQKGLKQGTLKELNPQKDPKDLKPGNKINLPRDNNSSSDNPLNDDGSNENIDDRANKDNN
jgi:RHS repeat-associated protein